MKKEYFGIYAALVTPYTAGGDVDYQELKKLVRYLIKKGIDGFYVGGSTAEVFLLSEQERKGILEAVAEENNGSKKIIYHVGAISTAQAENFARFGEQVGADAVSAISPFYYKFSCSEIIRYYMDIMEATALSMFIYNFPNFSGFSLTEDVLDTLKQNEHLAGVKFTSSDLFLLERLKTKNPDLIFWNGFDEILLSGLAAGADGGIGSTYNCMAPLIRKIYDNFQEGNLEQARSCQRQANAVIEKICRYGVFASVKTILKFEGFSFHGCRRPFAEMTEEGEEELFQIYKKYLCEG